MQTSTQLKEILTAIDRKSYPAYKSIKGVYQFHEYLLSIDHVQGDPFASPSKVSIRIDGKKTGFPSRLYDQEKNRIALSDHLTRIFFRKLEAYQFKAKGSGKSGLISTSRCAQEVLERTACTLDPETGNLTVRVDIGFPANGRTINSGELIKILFDFLPDCIRSSFYYDQLDQKKIQSVIELCQDQQYIRKQMELMGLSAFVANGSILPRETGVSQKPMKQAVLFRSPASLSVSMDLPHRGTISGMGIPKGITLIIGGGYHGKSTLLKALEMGVYDHIEGDGREFVLTEATAVKLRSEDSRSVSQVDISLFINNLPNQKDTHTFHTQDASGSTSQAANVIEGIEAGSHLFLIDEDTSATNFMLRDELMQRVVQRSHEPITPYIERVQTLFQSFGISSIIVAGSSGSYFHPANLVIQMDHFEPCDVTEFAKKEAASYPGIQLPKEPAVLPDFTKRQPVPNSSLLKNDRIKIKLLGRDSIDLEKEIIDLRYTEQLVDSEQLTALGYLLKYAEINLMDGKKSLSDTVDLLQKLMKQKGLAWIVGGDYVPMPLAMPRRQEIFACINRYRGLRF